MADIRRWVFPADADFRVANATVMIALLTIVLAVVATYQGWQLYKSKSDTEQLLRSLGEQSKAQEKHNILLIKPVVILQTETITRPGVSGDYLMIHNVGLGPALDVVTHTLGGAPITMAHRIILGVGQEEHVSMSVSQSRTTQQFLTALLKRSKPFEVCISYKDAEEHWYFTKQRFYLLPGEKEFGIDSSQATIPCN